MPLHPPHATSTAACHDHADRVRSRFVEARLFARERALPMDDFDAAERELDAAVAAMVPLVEGKPVVHVDGHDGSVFVCRRVSGLRLAPEEACFYGECDWVDPPEARPDELTDGMAISYPDCLQLGPGWFYDAYFDWYFVYEPGLVARSLAGDHAWVPAFLARVKAPKADPGAEPDRRGG
jgi:hypothetical protein